ncbi:MAG: hypothetical protein ABIR78_14795, partial [Ferruginibacter sp.]
MKKTDKIYPATYFQSETLITVLLFGLLLMLSNNTTAQPFLDIAKLKYTNSPNTGLVDQNKND